MPELKFLELLSEKYPTIQAASTEIINLSAILNLPKGTEHFVSDIHGEDEAFCHILNSASGAIKEKIDDLFGRTVDSKTRTALCTLIYYPEAKLKAVKDAAEDINEWYLITLYRLIEVCRLCSSKYTRSKVRKALPKDFEYILDELLNVDAENTNKHEYYEQIISTIIEIGRADAFIVALANVIKRLTVDRLHIVGDVYDRGPHADVILDRLTEHHSVDVQWGNHDIVWMGAAAGSAACIANVLVNSIKYGNLDLIENSYGINLRPLALFAHSTYSKDGVYKPMRKAIAVIQFKLEAQIINRRPEYQMQNRLMLHKINPENNTVEIDGKAYPLRDSELPTVDFNNPYELTPAEKDVVDRLVESFARSEKLQKHIRFLYKVGSLYKVYNGNLLFHGCIPMDDDGNMHTHTLDGRKVSGREFLDDADKIVRKAYYAPPGDPNKEKCLDFIWYLWCGANSPLFGRDKMTTFERMFVEDKSAHTETKNAYYRLVESVDVCEKLLAEFGLKGRYSHIINGHVPVRVKEGEAPIHAGGKLIVIDGGFCRAYQDKTGIAGYTMFYSSHGLRLVSHFPFTGKEDAISQNKDILSTFSILDTAQNRIRVKDTDAGKDIKEDIADLKMLLDAYRSGRIKEKA